jgi:hypothetical protein
VEDSSVWRVWWLSSIPVVYFETNNDLLVNILGICGGE